MNSNTNTFKITVRKPGLNQQQHREKNNCCCCCCCKSKSDFRVIYFSSHCIYVIALKVFVFFLSFPFLFRLLFFIHNSMKYWVIDLAVYKVTSRFCAVISFNKHNFHFTFTFFSAYIVYDAFANLIINMESIEKKT